MINMLNFAKKKKLSAVTKIDFNKKLKNVGIVSYMSSGFAKFNVPLDKLLEVAKKNDWIHELDEIQMETDMDTDIENEMTKEIDALRKENEELKLRLSKYENKKPKKSTKWLQFKKDDFDTDYDDDIDDEPENKIIITKPKKIQMTSNDIDDMIGQIDFL